LKRGVRGSQNKGCWGPTLSIHTSFRGPSSCRRTFASPLPPAAITERPPPPPSSSRFAILVYLYLSVRYKRPAPDVRGGLLLKWLQPSAAVDQGPGGRKTEKRKTNASLQNSSPLSSGSFYDLAPSSPGMGPSTGAVQGPRNSFLAMTANLISHHSANYGGLNSWEMRLRARSPPR
jgi:hypothetical protein